MNFTKISTTSNNSADTPIMTYNVPERIGANILSSTEQRLAKIETTKQYAVLK